MQIEYQTTVEDFKEAQRVHNQPLSAQRQKGILVTIMILAPIALAMFGYAAAEQQWGSDAHPGERVDPLLRYVALPLFPWVMILGSSIPVAWYGVIRPSSKPWEGRRSSDPAALKGPGFRIPKVLAFLTVYTLICLLVFIFGQYTKDPKTGLMVPAAEPWSLWIVPMIFWLVFQWWGWAVNRISTRRAVADSWELQTQLQRPLTIEFTAQGAVIDSPFSHCRHRWEDFPGVRETPTLFLLYISPSLFHIIPKRAFRSEEDLSGFRNMAQSLAGPRPPAFPVARIAPMPLPDPIAEGN